MAINTTPVASSCISSIGYDDGDLIVTFRDSQQTYVYFGVPPSTALALMQAPSKGRFLNSNIKGTYPSAKGDPGMSVSDLAELAELAE